MKRFLDILKIVLILLIGLGLVYVVFVFVNVGVDKGDNVDVIEQDMTDVVEGGSIIDNDNLLSENAIYSQEEDGIVLVEISGHIVDVLDGENKIRFMSEGDVVFDLVYSLPIYLSGSAEGDVLYDVDSLIDDKVGVELYADGQEYVIKNIILD